MKKSVHGQSNVESSELLNIYNENFEYDERGNITKLNRKGLMQMDYINPECVQPMTIDSLDYTYATGSNKLMQVNDKVPCMDIIQLPTYIDRDIVYAANQMIIVDHTKVSCSADILLKVGYKLEIVDSLIIPISCQTPAKVSVQQTPCDDVKYSEGFSQQSNSSYLYNSSGSMIYDPNKKITFQYNHLNLLYKIIGSENDETHILYNAAGAQLQRKYLKNNQDIHKIDYIVNKEYHNDTIVYVHHNNGRIIKVNNNYEYEYTLRDHIGNSRVTFSDGDFDGNISALEVKSKSNFYAYGMEHVTNGSMFESSATKNNYKFNGKEVWNEMNLGLIQFGARQLDPALGIWRQVDALSTKYPNLSPTTYCANNPIVLIDPDGNDWIISRTVVDGVAHFNITFKGAILNSSGQNLNMAALSNQIVSSIKGTFSNNNISGEATVKMNANIRVINSPSEIESNDHLLSVYEDSEFESMTKKGVKGVADISGKKIGISATIAKNIISGENGRTVPHEMGHTAGLRHPDDDDSMFGYGLVNELDKNDDDNLMYGDPKNVNHALGVKIKSSQLEAIYKSYKDGKLNQNTIFNNGLLEKLKNWWNGTSEVSKTY